MIYIPKEGDRVRVSYFENNTMVDEIDGIVDSVELTCLDEIWVIEIGVENKRGPVKDFLYNYASGMWRERYYDLNEEVEITKIEEAM